MTRRRDVILGMAALPVATLATAHLQLAWAQGAVLEGDVISTDDGDIVVHPVDHASLLLGFGSEIIYVDPVGGAALYEGLPAPTAILITHGHGDHFDIPTLEAIAGNAPILTSQEVFDKLPEGLKANASAIVNGDDTSLNGLPVRAIAAHNVTADRMQYHPVGTGNGYVLTLGDKQVYVAGDTEPTEEMLALKNIEIAFLPVNLPYTMTPDQAVEALNVFKPRIAYPYHYGDSDLSIIEKRIGPDTELRLRNWYPNA
ncbi:L-ascorbate metabolism protein UlaG, beta-lactamase superfamily [Devosia sp. YR412]|uniref:MBL fold metallo-hydrolase n=1 Tax=Devosia sp. YR412 TaxID=1881030 RepID=UPI0008C426B8|nr:MBL fold metallo-hydrolase [Devosia sp. YR412]SEQ26548.1 L-ascorbate metabolism protein UlaG, beta-lactamase superfamily [Devosia sp. YR412]